MAILKIVNTKGKYYDESSKEQVLRYILNPYKTPSGYIGSIGITGDNYAQEMNNVSVSFGKVDGVQLRHFIISFESWEVKDPKIAYIIGLDIARFLGREYQAVFSVHEDSEQLHIHLVVNSVSFIDGHRYKGTRAEFYALKNYINMVIGRFGIAPVRYISGKA